MLVVKAPRITSTNTHMLPKAAKAASFGWYAVMCGDWDEDAINGKRDEQKPACCFPQTL
jgi:hypothetical protein